MTLLIELIKLFMLCSSSLMSAWTCNCWRIISSFCSFKASFCSSTAKIRSTSEIHSQFCLHVCDSNTFSWTNHWIVPAKIFTYMLVSDKHAQPSYICFLRHVFDWNSLHVFWVIVRGHWSSSINLTCNLAELFHTVLRKFRLRFAC